MELLTSVYAAPGLVLLAVIGVGLLLAQRITRVEKRLIGATAVLLAGLFFLVAAQGDAAMGAAGAVIWLAGLGMFMRAVLAWRPGAASRAGPWAALFLLLPAFLGAVVLAGLLRTLLEGPARIALRAVGG